MRFLQTIAVSASGLTAERFRLDLIANNLANINSTRTAAGGAYRRKVAIFEECLYTAAQKDRFTGRGVQVAAVVEDATPLPLIYNPAHPDADSQGFVAMPNVKVVNEMADLITASRTYEANVNVFNASKAMALKALEIGKG